MPSDSSCLRMRKALRADAHAENNNNNNNNKKVKLKKIVCNSDNYLCQVHGQDPRILSLVKDTCKTCFK